jgi:hypothetical protein
VRKRKAIRVGVLFSADPELNKTALHYLILKLNTLQDVFEYELLPVSLPGTELADLDRKICRTPRIEIRDKKAPAFLKQYVLALNRQISTYKLQEAAPNNYLLITTTRFDDEYYSTRPAFSLTSPHRISILALGNWKRHMAPPTIGEFVLALTLRESVAFVSKRLSGSVHLGTKGCICDFTASLQEARFKALHGIVCSHCRGVLASEGFPTLGSDIAKILAKDWLGRRSNPCSPAGILAHLDYDLFVTRGLLRSGWEKVTSALRTEGVKELVRIAGAVILGLLIVFLSVHGIKVKVEP